MIKKNNYIIKLLLIRDRKKFYLKKMFISNPSLIYDRLKIMSQVYHNFMIYPESIISCMLSINSFFVVVG